jgi:hypothetical protein
MFSRRFIPSIALLLTGCASAQGSYPSLAKRPIESATMAEPVAPPAPTAPDAELVAGVERLRAQVQAGSASFDKAYASADRATTAASAAAVSSDAWVAAQVAVSALEAARNDSVSALASLDTLYVERQNAIADGRAAGGLEQVDAARAAALAVVDDQNDRIDALKARLVQP